MMHRIKIDYGFTLIELLITLFIVGILAAVAYPSYTHYIVKAHRRVAEVALLDLSAKMEEYHSANNSYQGASLAALGVNNNGKGPYYNLSIQSSNQNKFTLNATPQGVQAKQDDCGTLTVDQAGRKLVSHSTVQQCW